MWEDGWSPCGCMLPFHKCVVLGSCACCSTHNLSSVYAKVSVCTSWMDMVQYVCGSICCRGHGGCCLLIYIGASVWKKTVTVWYYAGCWCGTVMCVHMIPYGLLVQGRHSLVYWHGMVHAIAKPHTFAGSGKPWSGGWSGPLLMLHLQRNGETLHRASE